MAIERVPSGITGLDELMEGGFPKQNGFLISGTPGSGKTTFALQYIINGAMNYDDVGVFISVEEPVNLLQDRFGRFGWDFKKLEEKGQVYVITPDIKTEEGEDFMQFLTGGAFIDKIKDIGATRIAFDSLTLILEFSEGFGGFRRGTEKLIKLYADMGITPLLTDERKTRMDSMEFNMEHFVVDGLIMLDLIKTGDLYEKIITILKMKGTNHGKGVYPVQMQEEGMVVYPTQHVF
ncbi:MAG: hypothetical protein KAR87_06640 [Candidatus Aenigmarchaeota archaeon]|nr:hypothetical protein [Candidatus Aenigmarchaeota archaeon]